MFYRGFTINQSMPRANGTVDVYVFERNGKQVYQCNDMDTAMEWAQNNATKKPAFRVEEYDTMGLVGVCEYQWQRGSKLSRCVALRRAINAVAWSPDYVVETRMIEVNV
jgi:hypothetical protein